MNPTQGVLREAWAMYKAHWQHLLPIALVVYVAVGLVSLVLTLPWTTGPQDPRGAGVPDRDVLAPGRAGQAVDDVRDGRPDLSLGERRLRVCARN